MMRVARSGSIQPVPCVSFEGADPVSRNGVHVTNLLALRDDYDPVSRCWLSRAGSFRLISRVGWDLEAGGDDLSGLHVLNE